MYTIKQQPEDFVVKEIMDIQLSEGPYTYYRLTKKNLNTVDAVQFISKAWNIKPKFINFAGTKDKQAVTEQYISIFHGPKQNLEQKSFSLTYIGTGTERLNLGSLQGNSFSILVRNADKPKQQDWFINYFDDQRFGVNVNNHLIGKLLLKKNFANACELLKIEVSKNDYIGALRSVPKKLLQMYVSAYQSYLWNLAVMLYFKDKDIQCNEINYSLGKLLLPLEKPQQITVPIIGFGIEATEFDKYIKTILQSEGITQRDFIIREFPELTSEGSDRDLVVVVSELKISYNEQGRICKLEFVLPKGSYATMFIRHIIQ